MEATLLRMCLAFPKLSFSLWTGPPIYVWEAIASFDFIMSESVSIWCVVLCLTGSDQRPLSWFRLGGWVLGGHPCMLQLPFLLLCISPRSWSRAPWDVVLQLHSAT